MSLRRCWGGGGGFSYGVGRGGVGRRRGEKRVRQVGGGMGRDSFGRWNVQVWSPPGRALIALNRNGSDNREREEDCSQPPHRVTEAPKI